MDKDLVKKKLKYYNIEDIKRDKILKKIGEFLKKDFILDMRPFVPFNERDKLGDFFDYIKDYLEKNI